MHLEKKITIILEHSKNIYVVPNVPNCIKGQHPYTDKRHCILYFWNLVI